MTRKPRIFFFGGIRRESGIFSRCGRDLPLDVHRILEGKIVSGSLKFRILEPSAGFTQAFEFEDQGLNVEIGSVSADFPSLYGGKITPEGIHLFVSNVGRFIANPRTPLNSEDNILMGQLRIGSRALSLREAKLRLPGAASELQVTFHAGPDGSGDVGVALHVDVPSGRLSLYKGSFRALAIGLSPGLMTIGGTEFDLTSGKTATLDLVGQETKGEPLMRLGTISLAPRSIVHSGPPFARLVPSEPVTIAEILGPLAPDQGAAQLLEAKVTDLRVSKATVALGGTPDRPALTGQGSIMLVLLDAASLSGEARLSMPDLQAAKEAISDLAAREATLRFEGPKSSLKLTGQLAMSAARLRTLRLANLERAPVGFDGTLGNGELGLRFSVDTSTPTGSWSFSDPTGTVVMLEGAVRQLKAAGTLWFGDSVAPSRLQVEPGKFRLAAGGTIVRHALVFGAKPEQTKLSADIDLRSTSGFTVTKAGAEGRVEFASRLLIVTEPNLSFSGSSKGQFRLLAPLSFDSGAILGIQLADLGVTLIEGHAAVNNLHAEGLGTDPIKFADLEVTSPKFDLEHLEINVHNEAGTLKGRGLVFEASGIKHTADPQWTADLPNPRLPEIEATLSRANDALVLKGASVRGLDLHATRGSYRSRDGFSVTGDGVAITAARISESAIEQGRIAISQGVINLDLADGESHTTGSTRFERFEVTADGPKEEAGGTGRVHLADLQIDHEFPILQDKCGQDLQLKASLAVGTIDIGLRMEHSELHGNVRVAGPRVHLRDTSHNACEWNDHWDVDVVEVISKPVCSVPLIGPAICDVINDLVNVSVRVPLRFRADIERIDLGGSADHIDLDLRGARGLGFCVHDAKLDAVGKVQLFSVRPTFQASGDVFEAIKKVFDTIVGVGFGAVESAIGTSATNLGSIASQISPANSCG